MPFIGTLMHCNLVISKLGLCDVCTGGNSSIAANIINRCKQNVMNCFKTMERRMTIRGLQRIVVQDRKQWGLSCNNRPTAACGEDLPGYRRKKHHLQVEPG